MILSLVKIWSEKFGEAWTACMLCMVQGDFTAMTVSHALTASKTGALTGIGCVIASFISPNRNRVTDAFVTGLVTSAADIMVHPSHFGLKMSESLLTGFCAASICYLLGDKKWQKQL